MANQIHIRFAHGLGDCSNMAHIAHLYRKHGVDVRIAGDENKQFIWDATDVAADSPSGDTQSHAWLHPGEFWNAAEPDWKANKNAANIGASPLPQLQGSRESLWRELCGIELNVT